MVSSNHLHLSTFSKLFLLARITTYTAPYAQLIAECATNVSERFSWTENGNAGSENCQVRFVSGGTLARCHQVPTMIKRRDSYYKALLARSWSVILCTWSASNQVGGGKYAII